MRVDENGSLMFDLDGQMTYYNDTYNYDNQDFPNTERYFKGCLSLPIYPSLKNEELEYIVKSIKNIVLLNNTNKP